jgi:hypothetical protein
VLLQELLVLALQVLLEDDAPDGEAAVLVSEACFLLAVRRVEVRVVVDFAGTTEAGVECLAGPVVRLQPVGIEQVTALLREDHTALVVAKVNGFDEPLVPQMTEGVVLDVEFLFGHNTEGADGGQRAAVLAVQLVDTITIYDQLALLASRQVEVVHQAVARIVVVPVTLIVHARPPVIAIPLNVFARITPSSVRHRPILAWVMVFGLSVKTPWQLLRGLVQGSAEAPGRLAAAFRAWS